MIMNLKECLLKKEYDASVPVGKKVSIIYCHGDKAMVDIVADMLWEGSVNLWIGKNSIGYGKNFTAAILSELNECDLAVLFLSKNYAASKYAYYGLRNIAYNMIHETMKLFLVKLDDVNVQEILSVLQNYKYYDFNETKDITDLVKEIKKKVEHCDNI